MAREAHQISGDAAERNWSAFIAAYPSHEKWLKSAQRCNDYFLGNQWDEEDLEKLGDRPALTINEIFQVILAVRGHYSTMRTDVAYKPRRKGATEEIAEALTRLFDQILETNDYHEAVEPRVFEDALIEDRGFFDVRIDYDQNVLGEVKVSVLDPRSVVIDPGAKEYDPASWTQVFIDRWLSLDDIELHYGKDKRRSVESLTVEPGDTFGHRSVRYESYGEDEHTPGVPIDREDEKRVKCVRVVERQYYKLGLIEEFVDPMTGETRAVPERWEPERIAAVRQTYGLGLRKRMVKRVRWTVSADHVTLFDGWSPYPNFTVVPYFPVFRRGHPSGLVRHLLDPQQQFNKTESQCLHVINTTANSGWVAEEGSLANMTTEELEENGAKTGLVITYERNRPPPEKITPNPIPTGLEHYAAKARGYIHSIPGASALLGESAERDVSGVVLEQAKSRALTGLQVIFDNLEYSRKLLAKRILECVQRFYVEPRVYRMTDWRDPEQGEQAVAINQQIAGEIVNNVTLGEYEVVAGSAPARDTFEETQFAEALQLREAGVMIPDHHIILSSHLAGKRAIANEVKQLQGLGEPTPAQQMLQELELRRLMAEVAELEAKAMNLQSSAQFNAARAQTEAAGEEREMFDVLARYQMEAARLKADLEKKAADLKNKLELAGIHAGVKQQLTRYQKAMDASGKDRDRLLDAEKAALQSRTQLALGQMSAQAQAARAKQNSSQAKVTNGRNRRAGR